MDGATGPTARTAVAVGGRYGHSAADIRRMLDTARRGGVKQWLVEHGRPADPFATARSSYRYPAELRYWLPDHGRPGRSGARAGRDTRDAAHVVHITRVVRELFVDVLEQRARRAPSERASRRTGRGGHDEGGRGRGGSHRAQIRAVCGIRIRHRADLLESVGEFRSRVAG